MNILQITSSIRGAASESTRVADAIVARLADASSVANVVRRDLATEPHPAVDEAALGALFTPAADRTPAQAARVALDDALIAQVQAADVIVIGSPMYNFSISAQLKNWLDAIARAGVTFHYTAEGPEGLLKNKKVIVAAARGGMHKGAPTDGQVPYIRTILGFLGMTDITVVYSEGMAMGPEAVAKGQAEADAQVAQLVS